MATESHSRQGWIIVSDIHIFLLTTPLLVNVVFWLTVSLVLASALLLLYVFVKRVRNDYELKYEQQFKSRWRPILFKYLSDEDIEPPQLSLSSQLILMQLWLNIRSQLSDDAFPRLNQFAWHAGFDRTILEILQYKTWVADNKKVRQQILAINVARAMNSTRLRDGLVEASESSNLRVNVAATVALVTTEDSAAEFSIITTLLKFGLWTPYIILKLSSIGGARILHLVSDQLDDLPSTLARNLFSLVELADDKSLLPLILDRLAKTDDDEELALAIRALARIGGSYYKSRIIPFADKANPVLRINVASSLRNIGDKDDMPLLINMLSDSNWWVRYRAAQALVRIHLSTENNIDKLLEQTTDTFGKDTLKQAFAELAL